MGFISIFFCFLILRYDDSSTLPLSLLYFLHKLNYHVHILFLLSISSVTFLLYFRCALTPVPPLSPIPSVSSLSSSARIIILTLFHINRSQYPSNHFHTHFLSVFDNFNSRRLMATFILSIRRYEEYHLRYVKEFSETFFHGNKSQEWFKDRYDPLKMQEQEADNVAWASKESAALKRNLRGTLLDLNEYAICRYDNFCFLLLYLDSFSLFDLLSRFLCLNHLS